MWHVFGCWIVVIYNVHGIGNNSQHFPVFGCKQRILNLKRLPERAFRYTMFEWDIFRRHKNKLCLWDINKKSLFIDRILSELFVNIMQHDAMYNTGIVHCGRMDATELHSDSVVNGNILYSSQDADYFLSVAQREETRLLTLCSRCESEMNSNEVTEEGAYILSTVLCKILEAVSYVILNKNYQRPSQNKKSLDIFPV